jgi:hypothetical protein
VARVPTEEFPQEKLDPTPINPKTAATLGGEVVDLAEGIGAIGDYMKKVQGMTDVRNGLTGLNDDANKIHNQIFQDPDLDNAGEKARDLFAKAVESRANAIPDAEARNRFLDRADSVQNRSLTTINSMIEGKRIKAANSGMTAYGESFIQNYAKNLNHPGLQEQAIEDLKSEAALHQQMIGQPKELLDSYVANTIYKAKNAAHTFDIEVDPQAALERIKNDNDLTAKDSMKLQNEATSAIKRNEDKSKKLLDIAQKKNLADAMMKNSMGSLRPDKAEEMYYQNQISEEGYQSLLKNGVSPYVINATTDPDKYNDAVKMLLDPKISDEKKITSLIDMNSDGDLATSDMKHLCQLHFIPNKGEWESLGQTQQGRKDLQLLDKAEKDDKQLEERGKSWHAAWDFIRRHSDDPHNVSDLLQKLHSDLAKEQNVTPQIIQEKTTEVINGDNLKRNPQLANLPKEGHTVMNNHTGKVYWARPDGKGGVEITPYGKSNGQ